MDIEKNYLKWCDRANGDPDLAEELLGMAGQMEKIEDAFYRELEFGTGGLRGVIGAGTNRMNIYTVGRASQGLANYVIGQFPPEARRIAIAYDSRIKSDLFARTAAGVFAANGIEVMLYPELKPTPCLSYAVRRLSCAAGVVITASHNPASYNGYKVYGEDGCQITKAAAKAILAEINRLDIFDDVSSMSYEAGIASGKIQMIPDEVLTDFLEAVKAESVLGDAPADKDAAIIYSPLNGTGLVPVMRILRETGFTNITVVSEQEKPDGLFPTCPYPNPEIREAMELGIRYAKEKQAELLLATDPDCDRVGIAVRDENGEYVLLSGNETGMLLLDYICQRRTATGTMPEDPVMMKTIVSIDMAERIAAHYGVRTVNVLTGFKYIGEQIGMLEKQGKQDAFIMGFEESYGYLAGTYVRDKDGVNASFLIAEMFAYYKAKGMTLLERLNMLYREYGVCLNTQHSYNFDGSAGFERMQRIMDGFRNCTGKIGSFSVAEVLDYSQGLDNLPKSNVLKFRLDGNCSLVVRPSGTEPKLKCYLSISASDRAAAEAAETLLAAVVEEIIQRAE
ncbi:MAG: phospho-sugar mutase [Clostridia bacterium]|nr:phospho-sugar mutase [Clostridia bacterium]